MISSFQPGGGAPGILELCNVLDADGTAPGIPGISDAPGKLPFAAPGAGGANDDAPGIVPLGDPNDCCSAGIYPADVAITTSPL